jgi:putative DNA primase/helicase
VAKSVELVEPVTGKDVSDHFAAGHDLDELVLVDIDEPVAPEPSPWRPARTVAPEKVGWVWYPRIPRGKLTLVAGDPGVGKGFVVAAIVASATSLAPVPDSDQLPKGTVLWASFEDGAADTLRPRLENQGADLDKVLFLDQWRDLEGRLRPMRPADVPVLDGLLDRVPDAHMLVIDPVGSFIGGGVDAYRDNEVRGVLQPLVDLAAHRNIAVLVVAHLNKAELLKAIYRVAGSIGFVGIARSVLAVGKDEQSGRRGVAHGKTNLGPEAPTIEYRIVPGPRWDDVATLEWVGVAADLDKELLLGAAPKKPGPEPEEREECKAVIATLLAAGPRPADYCLDFLKAQLMVSESTIKRARKELGVIAEQITGPSDRRGSKGWTWRLP